MSGFSYGITAEHSPQMAASDALKHDYGSSLLAKHVKESSMDSGVMLEVNH